MRHAMLATLAGLVVAGFGLAAQAQPQDMGGPGMGARGMRSGPPTLAVTGRGDVKASPDTAVIQLGATQQAKEAQAAQDAVNKIVQAALERIKAVGVDEAQIQTAGISLYPVFDNEYPPRPMPMGNSDESREPKIVGYRASNTLQIEVRDLSKVGDVIDGAIGAGANQLQGLTYELRENEDAKATALKRAVEKARSEAETVAAALGLEIRGVERVEVGDIGFRPPMPMMGRGMMMAEAAMAPTPAEPGQVQVDATVSIVYRLSGGPGGSRAGDGPGEPMGD